MWLPATGCAAFCWFTPGETFTLVVEVVIAPASGYIGIASFIDIGLDLVHDSAAVDSIDEMVWPDCASPALWPAIPLRPGLLRHGCFTASLPPYPVSNYTGSVVEVALTCPAEDSTTEVRLLPQPHPDADGGGTAFALENADTITPMVRNMTVVCAANAPTPVFDEFSDATIGGPLGPSAVPRGTGDVNCDAVVNGLDAALILQLHARLILALPCAGDSDVNGDGRTDSRDALLLIQFSAGLISSLPP
ncbi:MAG: hypothetical protein IIB87_02660 [Chloroflexi bacterium]|nr:hypothetical protein [Chloroflexota bacterium]